MALLQQHTNREDQEILSEYVKSNNILHDAQIGFLLKKYRIADHVFTLRTLIDKTKKYLYACFVVFKRAFDSVWHDRLAVL